MTNDVRKALDPVLHWYESDELPPRPTAEIVSDVVADLQEDRNAALLLHKMVLVVRRLDGQDAAGIMPALWPLICEANGLFLEPDTE